MLLFERLAEEKIQQAIERGELDNLPGAGKPLPEEEDLSFLPAELRLAYRILKNAGYVPEQVQLRREIGDIQALLRHCDETPEVSRKARARLHWLTQRLGELCGGNLALQDRYYQKMAEKMDNP